MSPQIQLAGRASPAFYLLRCQGPPAELLGAEFGGGVDQALASFVVRARDAQRLPPADYDAFTVG